MSSTFQVDSKGTRYPPPLATHDAVASHSSLFWDTLQKFHSLMGTRFMVPVIGGKDLDLHALYVEVTKRGGFQKVISEKKWREISFIFNFSPTTTSASYVLKKHYQGLLLHYEQAYFFKSQTPLLLSTMGSPVDKPSSDGANDGLVENLTGENNNNLSDATMVTGFIDGKFDCGYLVSVYMGSETLRGVLYFPDHCQGKPKSAACNAIVPYMGGEGGQPNPCSTIIPYNGKPSLSGCRRRRRRRRRDGDPARPKPNRSGYNFYFAEEHQKLKSQYPEKEREFTKMIGASWNNLSAEEKAVYQGIGLKDKERYEKEKKEYMEHRTVVYLVKKSSVNTNIATNEKCKTG